MRSVIIIGVCGGSGSGKTTFANLLKNHLGENSVSVISQDNYYHDQSHIFDEDGGSVNFDHPNSIDFNLLEDHLKTLKAGDFIKCPIYDFATHKRQKSTHEIQSNPFVIVDGTLILSQTQIVEHLDISLFLDIPEELRFSRRLKRDTHERGRNPQGVQKQLDLQVKPMHDEFVAPSKKNAYYVLETNEQHETYIKKIAEHIQILKKPE